MLVLAKIMMSIFMMIVASSLNPVKTSFYLMIYSSVLMISMSVSQGNTWFSSMFYLLFMGGILIMFMILSAITPNEIVKRNKKMIFMFVLIMAISQLLYASKMNFLEESMKMKWFVNTNSIMMVVTTMIMMYFFFFLILVSKEKIPIRNMSCY